MDKVAETCLWALIATAGDCEEEGKPDRAEVLTMAAKHLELCLVEAEAENRRLGDAAFKSCATLRKARREVDATASPQHAAWADELNAAFECLAWPNV